ncbi:MAG TPA: hypothetical protein GX506_09175 [Firmicutes bacterium]|nr:hypothetical protein [Bacillota bacterium]
MHLEHGKIAVAILMGTLARLYMLRIDYRQYPSYPHGYAVHMSLGFIASSLGALAIPTLLKKDYMAVTILALAAQQFREVRDMERRSLQDLEDTELVPRGSAYIDGIAKVFEARNYLAMFTALVTSLAAFTLPFNTNLDLVLAVLSGLVTMFSLNFLMRGKRVRDIAIVREGHLHFVGSLLLVEDVVLTNIGLAESREMILARGLGVTIEPKDDNARATLFNLGQRQAIAHDASAIMGVRLDVSEREFTPLVRVNPNTGRIVMAIVPMEKDIECLLEAVRRVPVLESSVRKPISTKAGRVASD